MGDWFDDFMVMKILTGDSEPVEECYEDDSDSEELLEDKIATVENEISKLEDA